VRVYDPSAQRRPVLDMTWDEYPITAMSLYGDNQVVVGNTHGSMALLDIRKGKLVHMFRGFAGAIRCVKCHDSQPVVASCGLDRFFRLHDINTREIVHKKYMKSRLNCLLLNKEIWKEELTVADSALAGENTEEVKGDINENDIEEDAELWDHMEVVKTRTIKRKDTAEIKIIEKKQKMSKSEKINRKVQQPRKAKKPKKGDLE